jgi:hypothetical protein
MVKQGTGISASVVAILSSVATISCCLPIGFAVALGAGTASAFFTTLRPWLLGMSIALLALGFWQQHRAKQCAIRGRWVGSVLLWARAAANRSVTTWAFASRITRIGVWLPRSGWGPPHAAKTN